jgi:septum formation protein
LTVRPIISRLRGLYVDTLILASKSPRRRRILEVLGIPFLACGVDVDEEMGPFRSVRSAVMGISRRKAAAAARLFSRGLVLGADTVVLFNGRVLGKPANEGEAYRYIRMLSGNAHHVLSGISLLDAASGKIRSSTSLTEVRFVRLREGDIHRYLQSGEWRDKAGGYGIQGRAALFVKGIEGSYHNVMGLPVEELYRQLDRYSFFDGGGEYTPLRRSG